MMARREVKAKEQTSISLGMGHCGERGRMGWAHKEVWFAPSHRPCALPVVLPTLQAAMGMALALESFQPLLPS